jgi:hypothetical protein
LLELLEVVVHPSFPSRRCTVSVRLLLRTDQLDDIAVRVFHENEPPSGKFHGCFFILCCRSLPEIGG